MIPTTRKQVEKIAIELNTYDGEYHPVDGYPKIYEVWNFDQRHRTDWLGGSASTRALTGFDRVNPGGYRADIRITFRSIRPHQSSAILELLNDIFSDPAFPKILRVSPDENIEKGVYCNMRSSAFGIRRELSVGRQAVNMQLIGVERKAVIPDAVRIFDTPEIDLVGLSESSGQAEPLSTHILTTPEGTDLETDGGQLLTAFA